MASALCSGLGTWRWSSAILEALAGAEVAAGLVAAGLVVLTVAFEAFLDWIAPAAGG